MPIATIQITPEGTAPPRAGRAFADEFISWMQVVLLRLEKIWTYDSTSSAVEFWSPDDSCGTRPAAAHPGAAPVIGSERHSPQIQRIVIHRGTGCLWWSEMTQHHQFAMKGTPGRI